jgi:hypothetical protein
MWWALLAKLLAPQLDNIITLAVTAATTNHNTAVSKADTLTREAYDLLAQRDEHVAKANRASNIVSKLTDILG